MSSKENKLYDVVIVGTGFGGISAALELLKNNITNFVMLERRSFAGGTWLQNSYPGAAVDVQSPLYSLSGNPYPWSHLYAKQDELSDYTQQIITKYKLDEHILLNHEVKKALWTGTEWQITTVKHSKLATKILINATGPLSTPVIPKFKGFENYKGKSFHSNDWDHNVDLNGKRVAVIGSGASAAQIVPAIVERVKQLYVVQRTPHWILSRADWAFSKRLRRFLSIRPVYTTLRWFIYWLLELRVIAFKYSPWLLNLVGTRPALNLLEKQVSDPVLRKKLTPNFTIGCKRILVSNTFYPAIQRANCKLIDNSNPLQAFTTNGLMLEDGSEEKVDVVVFATGYNAAESMVSYPIIGRHGQELQSKWIDYPRAYLGTSIPDFPNLFVVTGPNTGIGHTSAIFVIESQLKYIIKCVKAVIFDNVNSIEPTEYAEDEYTKHLHKEMEKTVWSYGGCQSWYQNKAGKVIAMYPGFSFVYRRLCKRFKPSHHIIIKEKE